MGAAFFRTDCIRDVGSNGMVLREDDQGRAADIEKGVSLAKHHLVEEIGKP